KHALSLDADGDVLPIDDEAVEHRVLPRRLQPLEHLRERLLADRIGREVRALAGPRERQHALHHVRGQQLRAELDRLGASHGPPPNSARYSLVSAKRATERLAPEKPAFIASQPWSFSRRPLSCAASISFRSQK